MEQKKKRGRFAVLLCAEDTEYVKNRYGGYFGVFVSLLREEGETWDEYRVCQGEFPPEDEVELGSYDGFVITGSCNDAHGDDPWICHLIWLVERLTSMPHTRVLGICFGHQIVCRALRGRTGRAGNGWDLGLTTVHLSPSSSFIASLGIPSSLPIVQCHRDEVLELPKGAEVLAWSEKTPVEMFVRGDNVMGIQGHPEYTNDILHQLLDRLLTRNLIQMDLAELARSAVDTQSPNREAWKKLCRTFLKAGLH